MRLVRQVRATVNLPDLPAGRYVFTDWPPNEYVARMLDATYLVAAGPAIEIDENGVVLGARRLEDVDAAQPQQEEGAAPEDR